MDERIRQLLTHATWVRGLARCLARDDTTGDDLAQDAWIAALRAPPPLGSAARGWLATVLRNTRRMTLRGEQRRTARERALHDPEAHERSAADLAEEVELGRILADALLALDDPYKETLLLTFYGELSSIEIATRRGIPAATVRSHVHLGLERLRRALDERYGDRATWKRALVPMAALPRVIVKGVVMGKLATATLAAVGVIGIVGIAHHAKSATTSVIASTPSSPLTSKPDSALQSRIEHLRQQKPAYDALKALIEAKQPPREAPSTSHATGGDRLAPDAELGGLDPEYIRQALTETMPLFQKCLEDALVDEPDLHGKLMLSFTIEGDPEVGGIVSASKVDDAKSTLHQPALEECFEQSIYAARFPAPSDHGVVEVSYPFVLMGGDPSDGGTP